MTDWGKADLGPFTGELEDNKVGMAMSVPERPDLNDGCLRFIRQFPKPLALFDRDFCFRAVSQSWLDCHMLNDGAVIGKTFGEVLPDDYARWDGALRRSLNGMVEHLDYDLSVGGRGCVDSVRWTAAPLFDEKRTITGVMVYSEVVVNDLADEIEDELARQRLRSVLDAVTDGIVLTDSLGRISLINPAITRIFGHTAHELIGRDIRLLVSVPKNIADASVSELLAKTGRESRFGTGLEMTARRKDGTIFPVEVSASEMRSGARTDTLVTLRDISDRVKMWEAMEIQSAALEAAANGIVISDREGRAVWVNRAVSGLTGYSLEELSGGSLNKLKSGAHDDAFYRNMWETIMSGNVWDDYVVNRRKDGTFYDEQMTITPVRAGDGEITHFIAIKQDATRRRQCEQALIEARDEAEQALMAKNRLLATLAHEIRTPLGAMMGHVEMVLGAAQNGALDEKQRGQLGRVGQSGEGLLRLMDNILDMARAEGLGGALTLEPVDLPEIVHDMVMLVKGLAFRKDISFKTNTGDGLPVIQADRLKVKQILHNLLSNAVKWTPSNGHILLDVRPVPAPPSPCEGVLFTISDTGPGIPVEEREHVFEEFVQLYPEEQHGGAGFGLALAKRLVELHGGTISVDNAGEEGRGAVFKVCLPLAPPARTG